MLHDPLVDYTTETVSSQCSTDCATLKACQCSLCFCCSVCADTCSCNFALHDPNEKVAHILQLGDDKYRLDL